MFEVVFKTRAVRIFKKLDRKTQNDILKCLEQISFSPYAFPGLKKLKSAKEKAFRVKVSRWRVVYIIVSDQNIVEVIDIFMRKEKSDYSHL